MIDTGTRLPLRTCSDYSAVCGHLLDIWYGMDRLYGIGTPVDMERMGSIRKALDELYEFNGTSP